MLQKVGGGSWLVDIDLGVSLRWGRWLQWQKQTLEEDNHVIWMVIGPTGWVAYTIPGIWRRRKLWGKVCKYSGPWIWWILILVREIGTLDLGYGGVVWNLLTVHLLRNSLARGYVLLARGYARRYVFYWLTITFDRQLINVPWGWSRDGHG